MTHQVCCYKNDKIETTKKSTSSVYLPGPTPLPLLGNLLDIARADPVVFRALHRLSLRHGPIVTLWMGGRRAAVVSGREELKVHQTSCVRIEISMFFPSILPKKRGEIDFLYCNSRKAQFRANPSRGSIFFLEI